MPVFPRPFLLQRTLLGAAVLLASVAAHAKVTLVRDHEARAVVVVPDSATPVVRYAAEELTYHVERATRAKLTIVPESQVGLADDRKTARVYLGDTRAARAVGIAAGALAPETWTLRTKGNALYITGGDSAGDPLETSTYAGTLFGVYEWLERDAGVRWLWPGEQGTVVPRTATLVARSQNRTEGPQFFQRNTRGGLTFRGKRPELNFSPAASAEYGHEQTVFLRRHRTGKGIRIAYHHAFTDWWTKYGSEHPEWFQLVDGKRGPTRPGGSYSMCVSNPGLRRQILALWQEKRKTNPDLHLINACENGIMGLCECEDCRAWDGPTPKDYLKYYPPKSKVVGSPFVTDRYARFWLELQREAEAIDPKATVIAYNYFNYFPPPSPGVKLNRNILLGSYPSAGWFPRSPKEHAWFKQQWADWQRTGARLFSRGNYCLDGYTMPLVYARQYADEFQHQVRHGLEATDYDALTGQWAAQGPNLYLLVRLQTRPTARVDDLLAEYYSGFGAAAADMKAYFEYWETYALAQRETINRQFEDNTSRWRSWAVAAHVVFTPASFESAAAILSRAATRVADDADAAARVEFVRLGLEHAHLCADVSRLLTTRDPDSTPQRGAAAYDALVAFRREHERRWIANFNHCAWVEESSWRLPELADRRSDASTPAMVTRTAGEPSLSSVAAR